LVPFLTETDTAGHLVQSIREDYQSPLGFKLAAEKTRRDEANRKRARQIEAERARREAEEERRERALAEQADAYWNSLGPDEQNRLWAEALKSSPPFFIEHYRRHENTGSEHEGLYRKLILHPRLHIELEARAKSAPLSN